MKIFKFFGCKCYILKDYRNGNFDAKSNEGIFLRYSTRSKAYKCLNTNTSKIVESENIKFDEHIEVHHDESIKRPEEYKSFVYFYEGMPIEEDFIDQVEIQQQVLVIVESWPMNTEQNSSTKLHLDVKLNNEKNARSDFEVSTHGRDDELLERDVHNDSEVERPNVETRTEPRLSKYVKRHHLAE